MITRGQSKFFEQLLRQKCTQQRELSSGFKQTSLALSLPMNNLFILFVCLRYFTLLDNSSFIRRRTQCRCRASNFDLCSNSWSLGSDGSLACHTNYDTKHLFVSVIYEDRDSHMLASVWQRSCHCLFLRFISVAAGIQTPNFLHTRQTFL